MAAPGSTEPTEAFVYANWVRAGYSPFDLTLDFGYRRQPEPPAEFPVRVVMSWEEAKILHMIVEEALTDYEKNVGPIREIPGEVGPAADAPDAEPAGERESK